MDALTGRPGGLRTPASGRTDRDNWAGAVESSSGLRLWEENELSEVTGELTYIRSAGQRASQQPGKLQICFQSYCLCFLQTCRKQEAVKLTFTVMLHAKERR